MLIFKALRIPKKMCNVILEPAKPSEGKNRLQSALAQLLLLHRIWFSALLFTVLTSLYSMCTRDIDLGWAPACPFWR